MCTGFDLKSSTLQVEHLAASMYAVWNLDWDNLDALGKFYVHLLNVSMSMSIRFTIRLFRFTRLLCFRAQVRIIIQIII